MQQICKRTPMPKYDFNKVAMAWVLSCKFAAYFQDTFYKNAYGGLLLTITTNVLIVSNVLIMDKFHSFCGNNLIIS